MADVNYIMSSNRMNECSIVMVLELHSVGGEGIEALHGGLIPLTEYCTYIPLLLRRVGPFRQYAIIFNHLNPSVDLILISPFHQFSLAPSSFPS